MKFKNISKLFFIFGKLILYKLKSILFTFILISTLLILFVISIKKINRPTIVICNEEKTFLSKIMIASILNNKMKTIVNLIDVPYDDAKKMLDNKEVALIVHIKKGTINALYEGYNQTIDIYTNNKNNDLCKFIINYMKAYINIVNISQNAGLYYMDILYNKGVKENIRNEKFLELEKKYVKLILFRNGIFEKDNRILGLTKEDLKKVYIIFVVLFIVYINIEMIFKNELFRKNIKDRLKLAKFSTSEIYFTIIIGYILINLFFLSILTIFIKIIGGIDVFLD